MSDLDEFTICDTCLGDDSHLKMIKHENGLECKLCTRPFTVYRWNSKQLNKAKKTTICTTCARLKMCCQSCMMDIHFHIPLDIRDTALRMAGLEGILKLGSTSKNRELKALTAEKQEEAFKKEDETESIEDKQQKARNLLMKLASKLNRGQIEAPKEAQASSSEMSKLVGKLPFGSKLEGTDPDIKSFFVFGFGEAPQYLISDWFGQFGSVVTVSIIHRAQCGFLTFSKKEHADKCTEAVNNNGLNTNKNTAGLVLLDKKWPMRIVRSKVLPLEGKNEGYQKLSMVVNKVMKQLAEKDSSLRKSLKKGLTSHTEKGKVSKPQMTKKYKSSEAGFEL